MKTLRYTYLVGLALTMLATLTTGCQDDPLFSAPGYDGNGTATRAEMTQPGPLQRDGNGLWVATQQVPLVGVGRVADDISGNLLGLITTNGGDNDLEEMFDTDLSNYTSLKSDLAGANLGASEGICVKDLYHTYAGGQAAGFVIKISDASLLTADVLETMWVATSLDGDPSSNDGWEVMNATTESELVSLKLLSPQNSSTQTIQVTPTRPFNKIKLGFGGLADIKVLGNLQIYYAFVGENPVQRITKNNFPDVTGEAGGTWFAVFPARQKDVDKMFDPNYTANTDGPSYVLAAISPSVEVTLGDDATIPAHSEIGFKTHAGGALGLGLFGSTKIEYTYANNSTETVTLDGGVVGLSLLGGGSSLLSAIPSQDMEVNKFKITFGGLTVDVGGVTVNYAYYRDPVTIDPSAYYALPEKVTVTTDTYRLPAPAKGSVSYTFGSGPAMAGITLSDDHSYYILHGMTVDGPYTVHAIYTDEDGDQIAYDITVTRESHKIPACHTPITTATYPSAKAIETLRGGCLLCILNGGIDENHTAANLTDINTNNYAGYANGIKLAENDGIVAVDAGRTIGTAGKKMRVGFVMQTSSEFLNLSALDFYRIQLLDENKEVVDGGVSAQNETVGLGLLGGSNGSKIRYSIETDKPFRYVELYASGVLNLDLALLRIYYAFWEDVTNEACNDVLEDYIPGDACTSIMSAANNHADIWYEQTGSSALLNVQSHMANLGNILDDDRSTAATIPVTSVAGSTTLGLKFDKLSGNQQIGVLLRRPSGVADISLLSKGLSMKVYNDAGTGDEKEVSLKETSGDDGFGVLGLNLIGYGDYIYLEATPQSDFDGLVITLTEGLAGLLETFQIYGIYYRPDTDGDGIPDCSENPDENEPEGVALNLETRDVCPGDAIGITASLSVGSPTPSDGIYYLKCILTDTEYSIIPVTIRNGRLVASGANTPLCLEKPGIYSLRLYQSHEEAESPDGSMISTTALVLTVHPEETTWTGASNNHDWNTWDNWSNGSPWTCTNVIIPGGLGDNYPWLGEADENYCNYLYIENGGQLVNSFYLTSYNKAWVDIALPEGGRYYMLTSPLQDMVSGDWFVNATANEAWTHFTPLNVTSYEEMRTRPYIYQRLWSHDAPVKKNSSDEDSNGTVSPDETNWTPPYNGIAQEYAPGMGFSLMAGKEKAEDNSYTFRFPKEHATYHYYNLAGQPTGQTEEVHRDRSLIGRFAYEGEWTNGQMEVTLTNKEAGTVYLAGNPFVAHLNIAQFMSINGIGEIKVYDGNENNSLILMDGELVSTTGNTLKHIKPMEAFFVVDATAGTSKQIVFNADMLNAGGTDAYTRSLPSDSFLRLSATLDGKTTHALLRVSPTASAGVIPGEDTKLLVESEARPAVAIYTVADGQALDIQQVPADVDRIPLGFYLPDGDKADIRLTPEFTAPRWHDWWLVDLRNGQRRRLNTAAVTLHGVTSGSGQYALMKNSPINQ